MQLQRMRKKVDPIRLEVFKCLFSSVAEEMGIVLGRTAYSVNIKERKDFSSALFDAKGNMIAQAAHIPVHLGSMPLSVTAAIKNFTFCKGDIVILNDPFEGGTHLPDVTLVKPIFVKNTLRFFVAVRSHFSDIGGMSPGSMPLSTEIFQEGIRIPPMKIVANGKLNNEVKKLLLANVRNPNEFEGDLTAQLASCDIGEKRLNEIISKYGLEDVLFYSAALQDYAERLMREAISEIPNGVYLFEDFLDDDGIENKPVKIAVKITIKSAQAVIDFNGSSRQTKGNINAVYAVTLSSVLYAFRTLVEFDIPTNSGCLKPLKVLAPQGSVVNAISPAPVAGGNVETSQRIVDVVYGALAKRFRKIPAASQGTMNNVSFGGYDAARGRPFAYYETIAGGMGARHDRDGVDAVHTHMTNTLNTPIEAIENSYPVRITQYKIRTGSGGKGRHQGGDGVVRELEFLCDATVSVVSDRRRTKPYGIGGGQSGASGKNILLSKEKVKTLPSKFTLACKSGDKIRIETPGGGGYGYLP